jgi:hypothetical protein
MAPIHRTDVDSERWSQDEWRNFELWEKLERQNQRRRRLWVLGALVCFLLLSSVPVMIDRGPKWTTLAAARRLAVEINAVKREAAVEHVPYRIRFLGHGSLEYVVERVSACASPINPSASSESGVMIRQGSLAEEGGRLALIAPTEGYRFGLQWLLQEFCYDPLAGSAQTPNDKQVAGFAIAPVKDLATGELQRASVVLLEGALAEVTFN